MKHLFRFGSSFALIMAIIVALAPAALPALAGSGGEVLPSGARPQGYSLAAAAKATASFNVGSRTPDTLPQDFPFQILYTPLDSASNSFSVNPGTMLYVPLVFSDDNDRALWPYPDVTDPAAVSAYYFDKQQLGAEIVRVVVDGKATDLGPAYAVGAVTPGLPSGGNNYTVVAAFLSPLSSGVHTVKIINRFTGAFIALHPEIWPDGVFEFEGTYTVVVR